MILILEDEESVHDFDLLPAVGRDHSGTVTIWRSPQAYAEGAVLADLREQVQALPPNLYNGRYFVYVDDVLALLDGGEA